MKPKTARLLFWCLLGMGALIGTIGAYHSTVWFALGLILMVSAAVLRFMFDRCPHCGGFLGRSPGSFCPHCGKKIDE